MEIKDVSKTQEGVILQTGEKTPERLSSGAPEKIETSPPSEGDVVTVARSAVSTEVNESRLKTNAAIGTMNFVVQSTNQIGQVLKSVSGLVEQSETAPPEFAAKLAAEGDDLIKAIGKIAQTPLPENSSSFTKDQIRQEIEKTIGQALDIIFPAGAKDSFGLQKLDLSRKESIILTRSAVAKAEAQFESLRENVTKAAEQIRSLTTGLDQSVKSKEPGKAFVRAVDDAVKLTGDTTAAISDNPATAIESIGSAESYVLR